MVSGISNVGFQGGINTATNAAPYMAAQYQYTVQPAGDQVVLSGKAKKSGAKKGILATIGTALVAAAALYAGVKTGKLKEVANPTKWTDKLQNVACKGGNYVAKGVDYCKNSKVGTTVADWGTKAVDWVKGLFTKKTAA